MLALGGSGVILWSTGLTPAASAATATLAPAPRELAYPQSRFIDVAGIEVHYFEAGRGEPALLGLPGDREPCSTHPTS
jgi:hypothetical protein